MSISFQILGKPGRDNALYVKVNCGTKLYRILFDCGEDLLKEIPNHDVKQIDYLFFSHLHLDHAAGFDYFFRRNYDREKPVQVYGPEGTVSIIHNRLRGFTWNLVGGIPGEWFVTEIFEKKKITYSFLAKEGFAKKHFVNESPFAGKVIENENFFVNAVLLNHIIPSAAYRITEKDSLNIDKDKLVASGFAGGAWLEMIKDLSIKGDMKITIDGKENMISKLRKLLLTISAGDSVAYLTDFIDDKKSHTRAVGLIQNCNSVICESQYLSSDVELAKTNYHLTAKQAASLAFEAKAKKLYLFHISERYNKEKDYPLILQEAKTVFAETYFPEHWEESI